MTTAEPYLETGHKPTTPEGDTLLRRWIVNLERSVISQVEAMGGRSVETDAYTATDLGRPAILYNWLCLRRPFDNLDLGVVLREADEFFRFADAPGNGTVFIYSVWPTPDLRPYGWSLSGHPPLMFLPAGAKAPPLPVRLTIEPVEDHDAFLATGRVLGEGFGLSEAERSTLQERFDERLLADRRLRFWLGREDGQPVCAAGAYVDAGVVQVLAVATIPAARGKGYGAMVTWAASLADPSLPAMLFASDAGRPVYERMGYLPLMRSTLWYRPR